MGALHIIFKTCKVTSQLYPKESRKHLEDIKIYKNGIQLLCANSDPLDTIVAEVQQFVWSRGALPRPLPIR